MAGTHATRTKGHCLAALEGTYAGGTGPASLALSTIYPWRNFTSSRVVGKPPIEEENGLIVGVAGQGTYVAGEYFTYSGDKLLREFTATATTSNVPPEDIILQSSVFAANAHANPSGSIYTQTYNLAAPAVPDSLEFRHVRYFSNGNGRANDVIGGRSGFSLTMNANEGIVFAATNGMALSAATPRANVTSNIVPAQDLHGGQPVVVFKNATATLKVIGGSTYGGALQSLSIAVDARGGVIPDPTEEFGYQEANVEPYNATFSATVVHQYADIIRAALDAGDHLDFEWSVPGTATATNLFKGRCYLDISELNDDADGPANTNAIEITGTLLYGDRTAHTAVGRDPSESPLQLIWQSGS